LNIGTLEPKWIESMIKAGKKAKCPVVLDPVGSGATKYRTESSKKILNEVKVSVLRGNASEIMSLMTMEKTTKGVDSVHAVDDVVDIAAEISKENENLVVAVSGIEDLIVSGSKTYRCSNGHPLMTQVTGLGCGLTATVGAFCAVQNDLALAAAEAHGFYGVCGELAANKSKYPGSFSIEFIDALYYCGEKELSNMLKLKII
ncbi:MAG: hydroxyethylthiazole kinase, partial [Candidatus Helarchaeota archaeon]